MDETPRPAAPLVMSTTNERNNLLNKHVYKEKYLKKISDYFVITSREKRKKKNRTRP